MFTGEPYFIISHGSWFDGTIWIEFPVPEPNHRTLLDLANRLAEDFGAVVIERRPESGDNARKEYWYLQVASEQLLLMRTVGCNSIGLCTVLGNQDQLIRIGHAWDVRRLRGFWWRTWRLRHRLKTLTTPQI